MKKIHLYKIRARELSLLTVFLLLTGKTLFAQDNIAPEIIFYDYVDEYGVLKGGKITVYSDSPLHSMYKDPNARALDSYPEWDVETIRDNGPTWNRIDLIILGDGYQEDDLGDYASHVENVISGFFAY